ncbi:hypothetical protein AB6A40_000161 [Gnathostoma spinigerum]|uniref:Uncharacterized protein n=1 Tax=Gnathostoma spinigerum TaxID=75299 RepID=A0ABD6E3M0_9BILA
MMPTATNVDELIETEICNHLIRLSCAKMMSSQNERGGAKLHRNLLILHLLRRARDEQKRSPSSSPPNSCVVSSSVPAQTVCHYSRELSVQKTSNTTDLSYGDLNDSDEDDDEVCIDVDSCGKSQQIRLLDFSDRSSVHEVDSPIELKVKDDHIGYSSLNMGPLQLPFGTEATETEELSVFSPSLQPLATKVIEVESKYRVSGNTEKSVSVISGSSFVGDSSDSDDLESDDSPPLSFRVMRDDAGSSSESDDDENEDDDEDISKKLQRDRKRKTSGKCGLLEVNAKKSCVEERQLSGLISVFSAGLSVVTEQLFSRSSTKEGNIVVVDNVRSSSSPPSLPPSDQLVPTVVRVTCNPLAC